MPATNFSWPGNERQQIFQVFGTKRKPSADHDSQDSLDGAICKRQCTESQMVGATADDDDLMESTDLTSPAHSDTNPSMNGCQPNTEAAHQSSFSLPESQISACSQKSQQYMQLWNNRVPPLPDPTGDHDNRINNNNNLHSFNVITPELNNNNNTQLTFSQDEMIMDLNDEVYSTATSLPSHPSTDAEYEAACSMVAAMEGEGAPDPQQYQIAYCDQYCSGGDTSPSSGKVRCPCKPSWEGLQHDRPYVSDYY